MNEDQKKKYKEQSESIFPMEMIGGGITKTDRQRQQNAFMKGVEHAHPIAHSEGKKEGWNEAIEAAHGNNRLRWAAMIQLKVSEMKAQLSSKEQELNIN